MGIFQGLFDLIGIPLGWLLGLIYKGVSNYFIAIFLFTLIIRLLLFPLSLKSQKSQADRAKLAPRLQRLQKKYAKDPKKLQEKQMALYEKEGVSPTGGCLPLVVQMLVLFGIISVIYSPLKYLTNIPDAVIETSVAAMSYNEKTATAEEKEAAIQQGKISSTQFTGYYKELRMLQNLKSHESAVKENIAAMDGYDSVKADEYIAEMKKIQDQFSFFGHSLLDNPWGTKGFAGISILWLIPLLSGLTAAFSSILSMHYTKQMTAAENQPGQGCTNVMMLVMMPAFSLFITFTVPGGVGVYWICSNLIALLQTFVLNQLYNPAKIRAQAEKEYEERRQKKLEDKKRLAEARAREQRELALKQKEENKGKKKEAGKQEQKASPEPSPEGEVSSTESAEKEAESASESRKPLENQ